MKVNKKKLLELIKDAPDDAMIVVPGSDHSYRAGHVSVTTALFDAESRTWTEDYGEDSTPEAEYGKRVPVIVVE